jgi:hypothetical protein|tara:strand:- start:3524 stop:3961 length:438 start_codon:yes stop_codon:yes gene_type:complete
MAITFENVIFDKVIDNLHTILANEFSIPVLYDVLADRGNQSFLITPVSDEYVEEINIGQVRNYTVNVNYQIDYSGNYSKNSIKQVALIAERFKRLMYNNRNYSVSGTRQFYNAAVENIEYGRDEDRPELLNVNMSTTMSVMEIVS